VKATTEGQLVQGAWDTNGRQGLELLPTSPGVEGKFAVEACVAQKF
jgi:hypothetical protein